MQTPTLVANTTSISQPIPHIDRNLENAVASVLNSAETLNGETLVKRLPSADLLAAVGKRLHGVRMALMPLDRSIAEKERAARALKAMLSGWMNARVADPAAKVAAYITTLGDLPCWVVERVCGDVARGHVEGLDPDFPPSAARLHQLGDEVVRRLKVEADELNRVKTAKLAPSEPSLDERAAIAAQMRQRAEELGGPPRQDAEAAKQRDRATIKLTDDMKLAEYAAAGIEPKYTGDKMLVSLTLARLLLGDSAHG